MNVRGRIVRALAALIVGAAGGTVVSAGAAFAAACPSGTGVTVVVNSSVRCDANGGGAAASNFARAGHSLNSSRGFVCDIDGYPSSAPCRGTAPPDAYWGLFSANGTGGGWNYASQGAYSLSVPKGGWVAFKFQNSSSRSYPGMRPYTAPPAPAPKPKPKAAAAPKPKASTSADTKKATPSPSASATASKGSTTRHQRRPRRAPRHRPRQRPLHAKRRCSAARSRPMTRRPRRCGSAACWLWDS